MDPPAQPDVPLVLKPYYMMLKASHPPAIVRQRMSIDVQCDEDEPVLLLVPCPCWSFSKSTKFERFSGIERKQI